jgi:hypothetical protein
LRLNYLIKKDFLSRGRFCSNSGPASGFAVIRLPRDRFAFRGSDRRKNHRWASIFAAKEYETPLTSSGFRMSGHPGGKKNKK